MDFIPPEIKQQIKDAAANAKAAIAEAHRHNQAIEAQNETIIALLRQIASEMEYIA